MKIPQGWFVANGSLHQHSDPSYRDQSHFIRLVKTLYGTKQAARQWFKHLQQGLISMGFKPSAVDPCMRDIGAVQLMLAHNKCRAPHN
jgi:hypothetical protein